MSEIHTHTSQMVATSLPLKLLPPIHPRLSILPAQMPLLEGLSMLPAQTPLLEGLCTLATRLPHPTTTRKPPERIHSKWDNFASIPPS